MSVGEGDIGVCIWFEAPTMHRVYGLSFAWHWHVLCVRVHLRSHFGTIESSGLLLKLPTSVSVKNQVDFLAYSVWVMRCTALLWHDILRPLCVGSHMLIGGVAMCLCH